MCASCLIYILVSKMYKETWGGRLLEKLKHKNTIECPIQNVSSTPPCLCIVVAMIFVKGRLGQTVIRRLG